MFSHRERDRIRQEMITLQDDLKTLHAQQEILEAQEKRQNKHYEASKRFEATHINLLHFYRTVYLGVEEIFLGAKVGDYNIMHLITVEAANSNTQGNWKTFEKCVLV